VTDRITPDTAEEVINRLARGFCAQESEIWEEAGAENRRRWRQEARAAYRATEEQK
jgi:hypothetical protein